MSKVTTLVPKKSKKAPAPAAAIPDRAADETCRCEDVPLLVGTLHVTAKCPAHARPVGANHSRFHADRDLIALINADYAVFELAQSDRGAPSIALFCGAVMGLMRLIDSAPPGAMDLLGRLHREAETVLRLIIEMPNMQTPRAQGAPTDERAADTSGDKSGA